MYTAPGIITLIVAALVGTLIGNILQLRFLMDKPVMKSPFIRYGSLILAVVIMINIVPDPAARLSGTDLFGYGLWWVLIAFLVSFVRPPTPLKQKEAGTEPEAGQPPAEDTTTVIGSAEDENTNADQE